MYSYPNEQGRFGDFGGKFVPETLMRPLEEIEKAFLELKDDPSFQKDYQKLLNDYSGRPTALTFADQLTKQPGRSEDLLKKRRFKPYRRPQNQQCPRPGAPGQENGKNKAHC